MTALRLIWAIFTWIAYELGCLPLILYLREGVLSANLSSPGTFYSVGSE